MDMTLIWKICTILVMVFLLALSALWSKMGKKRAAIGDKEAGAGTSE